MKHSFTSLLFFSFVAVLATTIGAANDQESSLFDRSSFLNGSFLCLPLFDGCKKTSQALSCEKDGDGCGDGGNSLCVKSTEGDKVCSSLDSGNGSKCSSSRDCDIGYVLFVWTCLL